MKQDQNDPIARTRDELIREGAVLCVRFGGGIDVLAACRAALRGGLRVLEITLTTPGALSLIGELAGAGGTLVGGGTVLSPGEVRLVAEAGGRFVLSPVFDPAVVDEAHARGLLAVPGAATAAEILAAHRHGARLVKLFPSGPLGGPAYLRAVRGPLPEIPLLPTSGPSAATLADYLAAGAVAVGIGAEVFPAGLDAGAIAAAAGTVRRALALARSAPAGALPPAADRRG
jgi:2-dehydro-3-deoxyphosphogluconate aldolase/(4S)-4-hydroxy-2-oxoglutarate aldolase